MENRQGLLIETLLPKDTNGHGKIFGGIIMSIMDKAAAVACWRYTNKMRVVTAAAHTISFYNPINVGEVIYCRATVIHVGRCSMEVDVEVDAEDLTAGETRRSASGRFTMVAVDEAGHPAPVPPWHPVTEEELAKWHEVEARHAAERHKKQ